MEAALLAHRTLATFFREPDAVVLVYFGNDIEHASIERGTRAAIAPYETLRPALMQKLVAGSYCLNYLYWSLPQPDMRGYWAFFQRAYRDPSLLAAHEGELAKFVSYAEERKIPLLVVVFPYLQDVAASDAYVSFVTSFGAKHHTPVLDLSPLYRGRPVREIIVNGNDVHPNELAHRLAADAVYEALRTEHLVE